MQILRVSTAELIDWFCFLIDVLLQDCQLCGVRNELDFRMQISSIDKSITYIQYFSIRYLIIESKYPVRDCAHVFYFFVITFTNRSETVFRRDEKCDKWPFAYVTQHDVNFVLFFSSTKNFFVSLCDEYYLLLFFVWIIIFTKNRLW